MDFPGGNFNNNMGNLHICTFLWTYAPSSSTNQRNLPQIAAFKVDVHHLEPRLGVNVNNVQVSGDAQRKQYIMWC